MNWITSVLTKAALVLPEFSIKLKVVVAALVFSGIEIFEVFAKNFDSPEAEALKITPSVIP